MSIDAELLETAKKYNLKLSPLLEEAIRIHLKKIMTADWKEENKTAIKNYNDAVAERGVFSADLTTF